MKEPPKATAPKPRAHDDDGFLDRMANRGFALRVAGLLILFLLGTNIVSPLLVVHLMNEPERVTIYDEEGNIVFAKLRKYREATGLYRICAKEAVYTMFMRNPRGLDDPELVPLLLTPPAQAKLNKLLEEENGEFNRYQYHQKVEIDAWQFQPGGRDTMDASTKLQFTRVGVANDRQKTDVRHAVITLHLFRNADIATNKKYPLAVWDFDFQYQR
jgi:hypothetical protein